MTYTCTSCAFEYTPKASTEWLAKSAIKAAGWHFLGTMIRCPVCYERARADYLKSIPRKP